MRIGFGLGRGEEGGSFLVGSQHDVDQRRRAGGSLLRNLTDPRVAWQGDRAALMLGLAGDDAEKGRLAGAIAADQPRTRAVRQADAGMVDQDPFADAIGDVAELQHARLVPRCGDRCKR